VHHGHNSRRETACGLSPAGAWFTSGWRGVTCREWQYKAPDVPADLRLPGYQVASCCNPQR